MISVHDTLNSIEQASSRLRNDEDGLANIVESTTSEITNLHAEQAALFRALADIRLDAMQQEQVVGRLDTAERRALSALEVQTDMLKNLVEQREQLASELSKAQGAHATLAENVSQAADAIVAVEVTTENRMLEDLAWQTQMSRVSGSEARMSAAEDKAEQSERDCEEKSKPYLEDQLFVYLWQRGYGTSKYAGGNLSKMGDGYVARVVNYESARQNYFTLNEIPKRLRDHADRLKTELREEEDKLIALERAALETDGIVEKETAYSKAEAKLQASDKRIADLETEDRALEHKRAGLLAENSDSDLAGALGALASSMQRQDLRDLLNDALDTPTTDDERIVQQLQRLKKSIDRKQRDIEQARQTSLDLARKRAELERSRNEFRREGYDRQGGEFSNDKLIGDVIGGIIGGALSSRELGDALRSGYRGGKAQTSRPKRGTFGGNIGRSRGGGFSTGGGF